MKHTVFAAVIGFVLFCSRLPATFATTGSDGTTGDSCRSDRDCTSYSRCLNGICTVPPAVSGHSDDQTPMLEFVAGEASHGRFFLEMARSGFERSRGLGHRPSMANGWGMLFVFPQTVQQPFTMAPMRFPLDLIFIDDDGKVVDIIEDAQPQAPILIPASPYRQVLELNAGAVHADGIQAGDSVRFTGVPRALR
jgi:uncharacterized membrane protein (UPF0127 family)